MDGTLYSLRAFKLRFALRYPHRIRAVLGMGRAREALRREGGTLTDFWGEHDRRSAAGLGWKVPRVTALRRVFLERVWPSLLRSIGPLPGARRVLEAAVKRGLGLVLVSDYPAGEKLHALGLDDLPWAAVVDAAALGSLKPLPAPYEAALEALGLPPERVIHVGDRPDTDMAGARAMGMQAALRVEGRSRPDLFTDPATFLFRRFDELYRHLWTS